MPITHFFIIHAVISLTSTLTCFKKLFYLCKCILNFKTFTSNPVALRWCIGPSGR